MTETWIFLTQFQASFLNKIWQYRFYIKIKQTCASKLKPQFVSECKFVNLASCLHFQMSLLWSEWNVLVRREALQTRSNYEENSVLWCPCHHMIMWIYLPRWSCLFQNYWNKYDKTLCNYIFSRYSLSDVESMCSFLCFGNKDWLGVQRLLSLQ